MRYRGTFPLHLGNAVICFVLCAVACAGNDGDPGFSDNGGKDSGGATANAGSTARPSATGGSTATGGSGGATTAGSTATGGIGADGDPSTGGTGASDNGEAGAGNAGVPGIAGSGGNSGTTKQCNPDFAAAGKCNPNVNFSNDTVNGDGAMFKQVIPDAVSTMKNVACRVCTILYRSPSEVKRNPGTVRLHIYDFDGVANAGGGTINFSSRHIRNFRNPDDALFEFLGVLIHESVHLYQFTDGGGALVEGMADFVRIRAGHHKMNRRDPGGNWTDPYTTSGFFFSWLAGPGGLQKDGRVPADPDIGWAINQRMDGNWSTEVFVERLGQTPEKLWDEYQDAISN